MNDSIHKPMPCSEDAEKAVLSCILKDHEVLDNADHEISPEWFYTPANKTVFDAIQQIAKTGKSPDVITVISRLDESGKLEESGGRSGVSDLLDSIPTVSLLDHYLGILKDKYQLREIIRECSGIEAQAYDVPEDVQALADSACEDMGRVAECTSQRNAMPGIRAHALDALGRYEAATLSGDIPGISTGFKQLDVKTGGFIDSQVYIFGARPSFGKTALMTQQIGHIAIEEKIPVGVFSGEMSSQAITDRFFSQTAEVDLTNLYSGKLSKRDFDKLLKASEVMSASSIYIDDRAGLKIGEIRRSARRMKQKQGVKIIFLDYLQRYRADTDQENRDERSRYGAVSEGLKNMAKELNIPVVCLVQAGRKADGKTAAEMQMSDIEGCSKVEQDADLIGFLGRSEEDEDDSDIHRDIDLSITKQRNGPLGIIPMQFRRAHTKFSEKVGMRQAV